MGTLNDEDFDFFSQLTRARKNKNLDQFLKTLSPEELAKANSLLSTQLAIQVDEIMLADEENYSCFNEKNRPRSSHMECA